MSSNKITAKTDFDNARSGSGMRAISQFLSNLTVGVVPAEVVQGALGRLRMSGTANPARKNAFSKF
tara:strand:+ start:163 stop:360 length:198 start_codon:yes stop_codon:yes gene_type:complete